MRTEIIADASSNHMGDMEIAEAMIKAASAAGIDTIKFQSWQADKLRKDFPDYNATYRRHKRSELSDDDHKRLINACVENGIEFLTTCFDLDRMDFLAELGLKRIKVASPDSNSFALIRGLLDRFDQVIISTGMTRDDELNEMVEMVKGRNVTILHCVSLYPTPLANVNMDRMLKIKSMGVRAGFSDHTLGIEAAMMAVALGADIVEKHITLSRDLPVKDAAVSTTPEEFKRLTDWVSTVELMHGIKNPTLTTEELRLREIYKGKWGDNS